MMSTRLTFRKSRDNVTEVGHNFTTNDANLSQLPYLYTGDAKPAELNSRQAKYIESVHYKRV